MNPTDKVLKKFDERYFVLNSGQIILQKDIKEGVINPADTIDDIKSFLTTALTQAYRRGVEEAKDVVDRLGNEQIQMYEGKLPFVIFNGKADENEKIAIYRQALKDVLARLTETPL